MSLRLVAERSPTQFFTYRPSIAALAVSGRLPRNDMTDMAPNYLTVAQVARMVGKTPRCVYFWIENDPEWQEATEHIRGRILLRRDKLEHIKVNISTCPHCGKRL